MVWRIIVNNKLVLYFQAKEEVELALNKNLSSMKQQEMILQRYFPNFLLLELILDASFILFKNYVKDALLGSNPA